MRRQQRPQSQSQRNCPVCRSSLAKPEDGDAWVRCDCGAIVDDGLKVLAYSWGRRTEQPKQERKHNGKLSTVNR